MLFIIDYSNYKFTVDVLMLIMFLSQINVKMIIMIWMRCLIDFNPTIWTYCLLSIDLSTHIPHLTFNIIQSRSWNMSVILRLFNDGIAKPICIPNFKYVAVFKFSIRFRFLRSWTWGYQIFNHFGWVIFLLPHIPVFFLKYCIDILNLSKLFSMMVIYYIFTIANT